MSRDRGQAFAMEGLVSALIILLALLLAFQVQVVTPTTSGTIDGETRQQRYRLADDALFAAATEADGLSWLVRHYDPVYRSFTVQDGTASGEVPGALGATLEETVVPRGQSFTLAIAYRTGDGTGSETLTLRNGGRAPPGAVTASHAVTLYDNQTLTAPSVGTQELWEYDTDPDDGDDGYYPIPDVGSGPLYNVVEVRVTVW